MNTKLNCLLLDDELPALAYMRMLLSDVPQVDLLRSFSDPKKFLEEAPTLKFDVAFLDIQMPEISGLDLVRVLKGIPVIFVSAHKEYAVDAFELEVLDFIPKPVKKERLLKAIEKLQKQKEKKADTTISFTTNKGKQLLQSAQILHITVSETDKRDKLMYVRTEKPLLLKNYSFDEVLALLPKTDFCQINKRDIISLSAVKIHTGTDVTLQRSNEVLKLPLSDVYKLDFFQALQNFVTK